MIRVTKNNKTALMRILRHLNNLMAEIEEQECFQYDEHTRYDNAGKYDLGTAASEIEQSLGHLYKALDVAYANYQNWMEDTCGIDTEL